MNNLLERLHASFFFYLLTSAQSFVKIGGYLPAAVIMSIAMTFGGLRLWVEAGWLQAQAVTASKDQKSELSVTVEGPKLWIKRSRPVVDAFILVGCTHLLGIFTLFALGTRSSVQAFTVSLRLVDSFCTYLILIQAYPIGYLVTLAVITVIIPYLVVFLPRANPVPSEKVAPLSIVLKSFTLCLCGTVTALLSLLNFSLAAVTVLLLGVPLSYIPPTRSSILRAIGAYFLLPLLTPPLIALAFIYFNGQTEVVRIGRMIIWEWKVLGVWTLPFAMVVYLPLVWQAQATCILALM